MKYLYKYSITLIAFFLILSSCRKEIPQINRPEDYSTANFNQIFESFWNGMNNNYVFWDIDTTNWDRVYKQYKPLFATLKSSDPDDVRKAYAYFRKMTSGLIDSHYALIPIYIPALKDSVFIYPSYDRKVLQPDYHEPIELSHFEEVIPGNYLDNGSISGTVNIEGNDYTAVFGTVNQNILYFYFSRFALTRITYTEGDNEVKTAIHQFFDQLKNKSNIKGVILDVRGNQGGNIIDLNFLIGRMIDKQINFGYTRSKLGNGRLDYSVWTPTFVKPISDSRKINAPIVIMADLWSMSMAEMITMAIKTLPNGYFVGERTWGSMGSLTTNTDYNGGAFATPMFEEVYTSSLMFKYRDGKIYEGIGFPPDIEVKYDRAALDAGRDPQLEAALKIIP